MRRSRRMMCLIVAVVITASLSLTACGDENEGRTVPRSVVVTLQPEPIATIIAGCDTHALETWYELASSLIFAFADEALQGVEHSSDDVIPVITELLDLRDAIIMQPTPECVAVVQNALMIQIRVTLDAYQSYSERTITQDELREKVSMAATAIDTEVASLLQTTQQGLEQQLFNSRATLQAAPPEPE